ncbi:hypothetical protein ACFL3C_03880 [Patescibacteria group bacterium]
MKAKLSLLSGVIILVSLFAMTGCMEETGESYAEPVEAVQEQVVDTPEVETDLISISVLEVQAAFAEKYDKDVESITVSPTHESENHMRGAVVLGEAIGDGGIFLVAKVEGKWVIVVDGHGAYTCVEIEPYNFPADMTEDCYSE